MPRLFKRKRAITHSQGSIYGSPFMEEHAYYGKPRPKNKPRNKNGPVKIIKPANPNWKKEQEKV